MSWRAHFWAGTVAFRLTLNDVTFDRETSRRWLFQLCLDPFSSLGPPLPAAMAFRLARLAKAVPWVQPMRTRMRALFGTPFIVSYAAFGGGVLKSKPQIVLHCFKPRWFVNLWLRTANRDSPSHFRWPPLACATAQLSRRWAALILHGAGLSQYDNKYV